MLTCLLLAERLCCNKLTEDVEHFERYIAGLPQAQFHSHLTVRG